MIVIVTLGRLPSAIVIIKYVHDRNSPSMIINKRLVPFDHNCHLVLAIIVEGVSNHYLESVIANERVYKCRYCSRLANSRLAHSLENQYYLRDVTADLRIVVRLNFRKTETTQ